MKRFLLFITILLFTSCSSVVLAPYNNVTLEQYAPIYGLTDDSIGLISEEMEQGEYSMWYWGEITDITLKKNISYITIEKNGHSYECVIKGKVELSIGDKCFHLRIKRDGKILQYLICDEKRYKL